MRLELKYKLKRLIQRQEKYTIFLNKRNIHISHTILNINPTQKEKVKEINHILLLNR